MIKKMRKKRFVLAALGLALCTPVTVFAENAGVITVVEILPQGETIEPRVDYYEWVFKVIDGKLYKRLFNRKSGQYVGDWVLA